MNDKIIYDEEHMYDISNMYKACASALQDALLYEEESKNRFRYSYCGIGSDVVAKSYEKITQHIELLLGCCLTMETYVAEKLEGMKQIDETTSTTNGKGD